MGDTVVFKTYSMGKVCVSPCTACVFLCTDLTACGIKLHWPDESMVASYHILLAVFSVEYKKKHVRMIDVVSWLTCFYSDYISFYYHNVFLHVSTPWHFFSLYNILSFYYNNYFPCCPLNSDNSDKHTMIFLFN